MTGKKYASYEDLQEVKEDIKDIKDNHLSSIWAAINFLDKSVGSLRWWILGSVSILGIVLAILQVLG